MSAFKKGPAAMDIANILLRENADLHARVKRLEEAIRAVIDDLTAAGTTPLYAVNEAIKALRAALAEPPRKEK